MGSLYHTILFPLHSFFSLLSEINNSLLLTLYEIIPSERDVIQYFVNVTAIGQVFTDNYAIPLLTEITNTNYRPLTILLRIVTFPLYIEFNLASFSFKSMLDVLTRWL